MIAFGSPAYFALGLLVMLMTYAVYRIVRWRRSAREAFAGPQAQRWPASSFWPRTILLLEAAIIIVIAAARPQWGHIDRTREVSGIDLVIALDVSQSMTATDVSPSRIDVAEQNLVTLVQSQRGSRFGLVLFAGSSILRSPLTSDSQAMEQLIQRAGHEAGLTNSGSDLGSALQQAGLILAASENTGRAVILVSDGEDFQNTYTAEAQKLQSQGVAVFTAGVGTPQGSGLVDVNPVSGTSTPKLDANGTPVVTRLNEDSLKAIAQAGGGGYTRLSGDSTSLLSLRNDLTRLDQTPLGTETQKLPVERFQIFTGAAIVLLLLSWFIPSSLSLGSLTRLRRLRPHPSMALVLVALIAGACGTSDTLRDHNEAANRLYEAGDYQGALSRYQELLAERPDIEQFSYNEGNTLNRLKQYERAVDETQRALPPTDPPLGADTYYALGNHLFALGRFQEAYVAYRNALRLNPADPDAKYNLELSLLFAANPGMQPNNGQNPGDGGTPQPGEANGNGTPQPGEGTPGAGEGTPEPGEGTPQPGQSPEPGGTPGGEGSPQDAQAIQRALEDALKGIDENLTPEQAIQILDLLRQQQEQQAGPGGSTNGPDY
jgi:Ca-activated chloride channel family protein